MEKNRVIHQGSAERNYHIFYQLLYATTDEELQKLCLVTRKSEDYEFLNKGVASVDKIDDHEEYAATVVSFCQSNYPCVSIEFSFFIQYKACSLRFFKKTAPLMFSEDALEIIEEPFLETPSNDVQISF